MATYPLILKPSFSYEDHLMHNQYVADINKGLARAAKGVIEGQALSTMAVKDALDQNANFLAQNITGNTEIINRNIQNLNRSIEYGLDRLAAGIDDLRADFDIAMGQVISQFEMMRAEMRAGFDHMINILKNRRKTEAQEHFRDALEFYRDGCRFSDQPQWFEDALKHLLISVEQYERNPLAHFHIGHIYHYQRKHQNFEKALHHYKLCYTYGEADAKDYPVAAQGYFYAGWLHAITNDDLNEAIRLTEKALQLNPKFGEAHFHLAKFYAIKDQDTLALEHLEKSISNFDRNYCIKTASDPDFNKMRPKVNDLLNKLKNDARKNFDAIITPLDRNFDPHDATLQNKIQAFWERIDLVPKSNTYFAYLDGMAVAMQLRIAIMEAQIARKLHYEKAQQNVKALTGLLGIYKCIDQQVELEAKNFLEELKNALAEDEHATHDKVSEAAEILCQRIALFGPIDEFDGKGHTDIVQCIAYSPDERFIISGGRGKPRIILWDAETGVPISGFDRSDHWGAVDGIAFSPDSKFFATGGEDKKIRLFETITGNPIPNYDGNGHEYSIRGIAFSPDGRFIASAGDRTLYLWDARSGKRIQYFDGKGHTQHVHCVAFSPDSEFIVSGSIDSTVRLWNTQSGRQISSFDGKGHPSSVFHVAFSPDGNFIVSSGLDSMILLWDAKSGKLIREFNGHGPVAFSPDGRFIASCSSNGNTICLWEIKTGRLESRFYGEGHNGSVTCLTFSPTGDYIASGGVDKTVRLWITRYWVTKEEYDWIETEKKRKKEEQQRREQERRKMEGLCLICGEPIGFMQKVKGNLYCKAHSK